MIATVPGQLKIFTAYNQTSIDSEGHGRQVCSRCS